MSIHFTEASALAGIDRQLKYDRSQLSPAQYEIIRQTIYHTGDYEYYSLLRFSPEVLACGLNALTVRLPIVVDVPEIQVNIVPKLQQSFGNPVYCCATKGKQEHQTQTRAGSGMEILARQHRESIFILGQDRNALEVFGELIHQQAIEPSLAIITVPLAQDLTALEYLQASSIPVICSDTKGGATTAAAVFNCLVKLAWRASLASL